MLYKAKVAVCSEGRTTHSTQSEHRVEILNVKPGWWYVKKPLGFKRLRKPLFLFDRLISDGVYEHICG